MKLCNETITVFNSQFDPVSDKDIYHGTVIQNVSWFREVLASVIQTGLKSADKFTIRIPVDADFGGKTYVDPISYATSDPGSTFTFKNGDIIVQGAVPVEGQTPKLLQKQYSGFVTILGVTDNRKMRREPHWKVVGA